MTTPPPDAVDLVRRRTQARASRDFATADSLRDALEALGWLVDDGPDGSTLRPRPPFPVLASVRDLPDLADQADQGRCAVAVLVDGWPEDLRQFVSAVLAHAPVDVQVVGLDLGDVDGAGTVLHQLAVEHPGRVVDWHLSAPPEQVGWGRGQQALARLHAAPVHVIADISTVLDGDALTPLLSAVEEPGVVAAGWRGANVDVDDAWRSVVDAGPGEVDVLLGYLLAVRRSAMIACGGPHEKARFYRNADLELSLMLRESGGRLVVPRVDLPVHQERHHGYHDTDPQLRDRESRRNYDRLLQRFRGRTELLAPRV